MKDEKEPVEKITLLDVFLDLGLEHEFFDSDDQQGDILKPSSIFACVVDEAKSCVFHYNKIRQETADSQKANLRLLDKWLDNHIRRHGSGMAIPKDKAELLLRYFAFSVLSVFCSVACFTFFLIFEFSFSSIDFIACWFDSILDIRCFHLPEPCRWMGLKLCPKKKLRSGRKKLTKSGGLEWVP
jgi:hypothetical protein